MGESRLMETLEESYTFFSMIEVVNPSPNSFLLEYRLIKMNIRARIISCRTFLFPHRKGTQEKDLHAVNCCHELSYYKLPN